jgi:hypothetical protein
MRADGRSENTISLHDTGECISLSFDGSIVLLNKSQISIVEVIKGDTVRMEMGQGASNIFIKSSDVVDPVIRNVNDLRDAIQGMLSSVPAAGGVADCPCTALIGQTNTELQNVVTAVNTGNGKADTIVQKVSGSYDNGIALNQLMSENTVSTAAKLDTATQATVDTHSRLDNIKTEIINANQAQLAQLNSMVQLLGQIQVSLNGSNNYYQEPLRIDDTASLVIYKGYSATPNLPPAASGNAVWAIERIVRNGDMYTYLWANGSRSMTNVWNNRTNLDYQPLMGS